MTELRNVKADLSRFRGRVFVIAAVVLPGSNVVCTVMRFSGRGS